MAWRRSPNASPPRGALAHHPRIDVTDFEAELGTNYTYETVAYLVRRCAGVSISFGSWAPTICAAFIAGSAGATSPRLVPIAVVDRLGPSLYATASAASHCAGAFRLPESAARTLAGTKAASMDLPAWPQIAAVLDSIACGTGLAKAVETLNRACLS